MKRTPNRWGCVPSEDVCLEHCEPLVCRHGCENAKEHQCAELAIKRTEDALRKP